MHGLSDGGWTAHRVGSHATAVVLHHHGMVCVVHVMRVVWIVLLLEVLVLCVMHIVEVAGANAAAAAAHRRCIVEGIGGDDGITVAG